MRHAKLGSAARQTGFLVAVLLGAVVANGRAMAAGEAADPFDTPISVQRLTPKNAGPGPEIVCTRFADLTIREQQDGPTSKDAGLIAKGGTCGRGKISGEKRVKTADMYFLGRKGPALVFQQMDAQGASGFVVVDADTGAIVFRDATVGEPAFTAASWADGQLSLSYTRGVNAPCSMLKDPAGCAAQLETQKLMSVALASRMKPGACAASYREASAPDDNPSILSHLAEMVLVAGQRPKRTPRGPINCSPMP